MTNITCGLTAKKPASAPCPTLVIEYGTALLYLQVYISMSKYRHYFFVNIITARAYARAVLGAVILSVCPSVRPSICPSVRLSVTRVDCDKTK